MAGLAMYGLLWVSFGFGHSVLAAPLGRAWLARIAGVGERLAYNAIAVVHLAIVLAVGGVLFRGVGGFSIGPAARGVMLVTALAGLVVLAVAGRSYDLARFLGLTAWRRGVVEAALPVEPLATGRMNAVVRHPLYLGVILVLFGVSTTPFRLATAVFGTIYVLIGIYFEERKLLRLYGAAYAAYRARVPMLVPRRMPMLMQILGQRRGDGR
jgi:protein-S-isoprenylcysteine O-methyltransferase Ste14